MKVETLEKANELQEHIKEIDERIQILYKGEIVFQIWNNSTATGHYLKNWFTEDETLEFKSMILAPLKQKKEALEKEFENL